MAPNASGLAFCQRAGPPHGKAHRWLTPTAPYPAFAIGEKMDDPIQMYINDIFTVPASLAGLPAISVPGGLSGDGLPLGLHLIAKPWDEATLFRAADVLERAAGFDAVPTGGVE